jgi:hypothetical protein
MTRYGLKEVEKINIWGTNFAKKQQPLLVG